MKNQIISEISRQMIPFLDNAQMEHLQSVLQHCLWGVTVTLNTDEPNFQENETNQELLTMFLSSKRVEGCSEKNTEVLRNFNASFIPNGERTRHSYANR